MWENVSSVSNTYCVNTFLCLSKPGLRHSMQIISRAAERTVVCWLQCRLLRFVNTDLLCFVLLCASERVCPHTCQINTAAPSRASIERLKLILFHPKGLQKPSWLITLCTFKSFLYLYSNKNKINSSKTSWKQDLLPIGRFCCPISSHQVGDHKASEHE